MASMKLFSVGHIPLLNHSVLTCGTAKNTVFYSILLFSVLPFPPFSPQSVSVFVSSYTMTAIAVDRYQVSLISFPSNPLFLPS